MRRRAPATKPDRQRDEATAEPHYRDEGFQAHLHDTVPVTVPASVLLPVPVAVAITEQHHAQNHQPVVVPNTASITEPDVLMTDSSPAAADESIAATTTIAAAPATSIPGTTSTATSTPLHEQDIDIDIDDDVDHYDSDIDIDLDLDLDLPFYGPLRPPFLLDLQNPALPPNLEPDYIASHPEDYDLDMSDSDGGAPLDDIIAAANVDIPVSQLILQSHHSPPPDGDDHAQVPVTSPLDYSHPFTFSPPIVAGAGLTMDAPLPPGWGLPPNDAPPLNQPPVPQPAPPEMDPLDDAPLVSNPNPTMFGSENQSLMDFLRQWAVQARASPPNSGQRAYAPCPYAIREQASRRIEEVRYPDLRGDSCDMQGLDWAAMGTTRDKARTRRFRTYKNYVNNEGTDQWTPHLSDVKIPSTDSFFRFRNMLIRRDVFVAHFQLRSVLACPSRTQVFYPGAKGVNRINPVSKKTEVVLNMSGISGLGSVISALDANHGILMAGMFNGEYCLKNIDSEDTKHFADGQITSNPSGITNHLQIHLPRRSSGPVAALSNNDNGFRILDLTTEKFLLEKTYSFPLNCTSVSPDGRLRVMVGDNVNAMIVNAETGQLQQTLTGHRDFGFSCDWSDDGWTVATGFQDKGVKIWDARRWCNSSGMSMPLCTIRTQMAGVRSLRFSRTGSGQRVLVAAEEADFVNIIDAQTFSTKQVVEIFGEIGGIAFTNEGQDLNVLCSDHHRGGLLQFERCGRGPEPFFEQTWRREPGPYKWLAQEDKLRHADEPYRRRPGMLDSMAIF
ncbi:hypothetical protein QQZ08_010921 [Neonectria magnoliae]|uniref:DUF2415 domain-containing protein n=1 Tax=Neonectria magnoliae TaxID=2732573 RepID=A0ABR1HDU9_9HYPO